MNKDAAVPFSICAAQAGDEGAIVALLRELADYERASGFALTEVAVLRDLIGENRVAHCDLVFVGDAPAAIVVWFSVYRSFGAARGLYVEDLYFRPAFRRQGLGAKLLARGPLRNGTLLESIDLADAGIGSDGGDELAAAARAAPRLRLLELEYNELGHVGTRALEAARSASLTVLL